MKTKIGQVKLPVKKDKETGIKTFITVDFYAEDTKEETLKKYEFINNYLKK